MNQWRGAIINLVVAMLFALPCFAAVVSSAVPPTTRTTGTTITASIWNSDVGGIYTYINNNIIPVLNTVTTKGDLYVYDGAALQRQAVGSDNQVLTADSAQANGIKWASFANASALTTKGDLSVYGASATRLPIGSNTQVLTADSAQTTGMKWAAPAASLPTGVIIAWSPLAAGTSTIPSGWLLCDGTSGTPNLIGRFIIGTKPSGSGSAASAGGYGALTVDTNGTGTATHTHSLPSVSGSTSAGTNAVANASATSPTFQCSTSGHSHTFTVPAGTSGSTSTEPADYALVYIMKQ